MPNAGRVLHKLYLSTLIPLTGLGVLSLFMGAVVIGHDAYVTSDDLHCLDDSLLSREQLADARKPLRAAPPTASGGTPIKFDSGKPYAEVIDPWIDLPPVGSYYPDIYLRAMQRCTLANHGFFEIKCGISRD